MPAIQPAFDSADLDTHAGVLGPVDAAQEDAHWRGAFWCEPYYSRELDYEDYAPAYCVGYIGYAQYGGQYHDAEASLCANWERIKGDSRLTLCDARQAMRAAWDRAALREDVTSDCAARQLPFPAAAAMHAAPG